MLGRLVELSRPKQTASPSSTCAAAGEEAAEQTASSSSTSDAAGEGEAAEVKDGDAVFSGKLHHSA